MRKKSCTGGALKTEISQVEIEGRSFISIVINSQVTKLVDVLVGEILMRDTNGSHTD